jgi:hypothetical protein
MADHPSDPVNAHGHTWAVGQPWQSGDYYQQPVSGYPVSPGYPQYPGYPVPYVQPAPVMPTGPVFQPLRTSGFAVASLVLSIVGLAFGCCSFGVPSLLAVIFGHIGLAQTRAGRMAGNGMAVAGLVMGYIFVVPAVLFSIWFLLAGGLAAMQEPSY